MVLGGLLLFLAFCGSVLLRSFMIQCGCVVLNGPVSSCLVLYWHSGYSMAGPCLLYEFFMCLFSPVWTVWTIWSLLVLYNLCEPVCSLMVLLSPM